jgi:hypothetical protein
MSMFVPPELAGSDVEHGFASYVGYRQRSLDPDGVIRALEKVLR